MRFINNDLIVIIFISLIFLCLSLPYINIPAIDSDEACDGLFAYYMLEYHPQAENFQLPLSFKIIGNRFFPVMFNQYVGAVQSYLLLPFFALQGMSVFSLRLLPIIFALLALIFIYRTCKIWFSRKAAIFTVCLTMTNPVYIHLARQGLMNEEIFSLVYFWVALFFISEYKIYRKSPYLFAGCYFLGLGLSDKITFIWYISGLSVGAIYLWPDIRKAYPRRLRDYFFSFVSFCAGSFFILFYNLSSAGGTVKYIFKSIFLNHNNIFNVNRLAYFDNLRLRTAQFYNGILRGDSVHGFSFPRPDFAPVNNLLPVLFFAGLVLFLLLPQGFNKFSKKKIIFFCIVYSSVFLCSPFTLSVFDINHLLVLFPFPQLIAALLLAHLLAFKIKKRIIMAAVSISVYSILALTLVLNINLTAWYYWQGAKNGQGPSLAVYELADYLAKNKINGPVIAMQGRLHHNIPFLTHGEVFVYNREGISNDEFRKLLESYLSGERGFYVIGSDDLGIPGRMKYQEFMDLADRHKRQCRIIKIFYDKLSAAPKYYLLKVFPL